MNRHAVTWSPDMESLGRSVVAIGVFDGVHRGHQELLRDTVSDAARREARAVALTFDRDPDQVVTPESAAPQLLTLDDKIEAILSLGISRVLVVPFTPEMASTEPDEFLDAVLGSCCELVSIHVGENFRFGRRAAGDLDTLYVWGVEHNIDVIAQQLAQEQGHPVSSTRIRGLISVGDIESAAGLLGRAPRLIGRVVRGRGEGARLGFATANVELGPFAALPASGVYAGIAQLEDGTRWAAAVSVGIPPMFPQAKDTVETHLIDFEGDIYGQRLAVDLYQRLRDQTKFDSLDALSAQVRADCALTVAILCQDGVLEDCLSQRAEGARVLDERALEDEGDWRVDSLIVGDPEALEAAERAVAQIDAAQIYGQFDESWVEVLGPVSLVNVTGPLRAFEITAPLQAAGIPYLWSPFSPESLTAVRPELMNARRFTLFVPPEFAQDARAALGDAESESGD